MEILQTKKTAERQSSYKRSQADSLQPLNVLIANVKQFLVYHLVYLKDFP